MLRAQAFDTQYESGRQMQRQILDHIIYAS